MYVLLRYSVTLRFATLLHAIHVLITLEERSYVTFCYCNVTI